MLTLTFMFEVRSTFPLPSVTLKLMRRRVEFPALKVPEEATRATVFAAVVNVPIADPVIWVDALKTFTTTVAEPALADVMYGLLAKVVDWLPLTSVTAVDRVPRVVVKFTVRPVELPPDANALFPYLSRMLKNRYILEFESADALFGFREKFSLEAGPAPHLKFFNNDDVVLVPL